jgi:hypothetical protein
MRFIHFLIGLFLIPLFAIAQEVIAVPPTGDELVQLLQSILSLKGAGTLAIATVGIQAGMLVARLALQGKNHKHLVPVLLLLSLGAAVVQGLISGLGVPAILMSAAFMAALQNFGFTIYKQYIQKP